MLNTAPSCGINNKTNKQPKSCSAEISEARFFFRGNIIEVLNNI